MARDSGVLDRLGRYATELGFPYGLYEVDEGQDASWDSEHRCHIIAPNAVSLAHEIAHFLVAPPSRRHRPFFGLGNQGFLGDDRNSTTVSDRYAYREENFVCLLHMALVSWAGFNDTRMNTALNNLSFAPDELLELYQGLIRLGERDDHRFDILWPHIDRTMSLVFARSARERRESPIR